MRAKAQALALDLDKVDGRGRSGEAALDPRQPARQRGQVHPGRRHHRGGRARRGGEAGAEAVIDVVDSGPGVPAEERDAIFNSFFRGRAKASGRIEGTGLGLAIAREFAEAHGGRISVVPRHAQRRAFPRHAAAQGGAQRWRWRHEARSPASRCLAARRLRGAAAGAGRSDGGRSAKRSAPRARRPRSRRPRSPRAQEAFTERHQRRLNRLRLATLLAALPAPLRDDARAMRAARAVADAAGPASGASRRCSRRRSPSASAWRARSSA